MRARGPSKRIAARVLAALAVAAVLTVSGCLAPTSSGTDEPDPGVLLPAAGEDGLIGYIDTTGAWVIEPQYPAGLPFEAGVAPVLIDDALWGYIDEDNQLVIEAQFEDARSHTADEQLARVVAGGLWGFIDTSGSFVIEPQFVNASGFCDGVAVVQTETGVGYIDTAGEWVLEPELFNAGTMCLGLAPAYDEELELFGYIDMEGEIVIEPQFQEAYEFSEDGLALFGQDGLYGYIDTTGAVVIEPQFEWASTFGSGLAPANRPGAQVGFIGTDGEWVLDPQYEDAGVFFGDYCIVNDGEREFWINTDGVAIYPG
jgi:hypothetical protein